ncbi:MAG: cytochrome c oxidase accessory protein CcoG [Roseateles asaccharophilus]|uniref:Cytochrome c oxidase accessory protein FixG n=1 Tax=Roseateles asaccharophilus TaxID=582607 RepID=A0A4R6N9D1_9BURK|nr:cytochrome c oxidase accessory protein CcoG [Roseateles asaccharophilus]MDN3543785.1 cytochrome c oxidase accessory protein CcoG [Roseateles asaccharophilus]TDP11837.1 cytochrome c oxidase accessory protein FixG [Roseateles asaccharophilus]
MSSSSSKSAKVVPIVPAEGAGEMVSLYEAQKKIYPRSVRGWFAAWRWVLVWATQLLFYGLPWLEWNARQAVLFDLGARRFYIFGMVLYPQDFIYLTALLMLSAYALFFFTAVAGRLWCGYACPQTVYTEIFMWVEQKFEGDRMARMKLDAGPWNFNKLWRKSGKQLSWIAIGLWTGITFVGYFTPIKVLIRDLASLGLGPWEWFWVLFYGFATYGNAGYMREQVCKYMCPYARFQSAMFDRDTLIISYDAERGEPRGSRSKKADPKTLGLGSCIDCTLCVQVCPTGIDIRKGLQYECIGCAACIDVCDEVMDKMSYPRGLIRYDTENGLEQHLSGVQRWRRVLRPRVLIYGGILLLLSAAMLVSLAMRSPFKVDVVRDRASLARQIEDGVIENVYRLQLMNATEMPQRYEVTADGLPGMSLSRPVDVTLGPAEARWVSVALRLPPENAARSGAGAHPIHFQIRRLASSEEGERSLSEKSTFVVPR